MRELNLDWLRTLLAIVDSGSFAGAARALHLAPPTVSLHVAELESRFGAALLLRQRGGVVASGIGETLVARARTLLALADATRDELERQVQGRSGRVRLGASTGALAHLLPRALEALAGEHPGIDVEVTVLTSEESLARLHAGTLDIGLVALPQAPIGGLRITAWRRDPVKAFVPAAWATPKHASPDWLASRPLIMNDTSTRLSRISAEWFAQAGQHPRPRIELNFNDAIRSLVAAGYGAALLPHEAGAPAHDPRVRILPLRPSLWRALGIACRQGPAEPATRHVLAVLARYRQG